MRLFVIAGMLLVGCRFDLPDSDGDRGCSEACASGACFEDGACVDASRVIYAAPDGSDAPGCGTEEGGDSCSLARALLEVAAPRDVIRLAPGMYTVPAATEGLDFSAKSATVIAHGATLVRPAPDGAILSVRSGQTLRLLGGTLQGPSNTTDGLKCDTGGKLLVYQAMIERMARSGIVTDSCDLTVSRSTLRHNLEGGIRMINAPRTATLTNNFVYRNGKEFNSVAGMDLILAPGSRVEFNTIVDNRVTVGTASSGINCLDPFDTPNNLVYRNTVGRCTVTGSYVVDSAPAGDNAPGFERPDDPTNPSYRLSAASPAAVRDVVACVGIDFDGDPRPVGG